MKNLLTFISIIVFAGISAGQSNSWKGLTPLRSTRTDVERLLGNQIDLPRSFPPTYRKDGTEVEITYSRGDCDEGWNVSKDTVLRFSVISSPNERITPDELGVARNRYFFKGGHISQQGEYLDPLTGLSYYFVDLSAPNQKPRLVFRGYAPKTSDNNLRCDGFPRYSPEADYQTDNYRSFSIVRGLALKELISWLDGLFIVLSNVQKNYLGYLVVYFDKKAPLARYEKQLDIVKKRLFVRWQLPRERLKIIEGGFRKDAEIEFYTLSKDAAPPVPTPSFASPQFMSKKTAVRN
jgi:hypothetical protein